MGEVPADPAFTAMSDVVLAITGELRLDVVLDRLVHAARELGGARYAALGIPEVGGSADRPRRSPSSRRRPEDADEDGTGFDQFLHAGMSDELVAQLGPLPRTHGLLGATLLDPRPFRSADITKDPRFRGWWPSAHPVMRSFLGVPIVARGDIIGALYLTDKEGAAEFDEHDERVIVVLAAHAAIAIENARLFAASRELSIAEERNRLARDLHDAMTQTLFSLTLTAETAAGLLRTDPDRAERELRQVQRLAHETQAELRSLVFGLRPPELDRDGLVTTVGKQLDVLSRAHGLKAEVRSRGDAVLATETEREVYRIVQEALNNVVRHAGATSVTVDVDLSPETVAVVVRDDGKGFDPEARAIHARRLGLTSMRERASDLGGEIAIESSPGAGTTVRIEVPNAG